MTRSELKRLPKWKPGKYGTFKLRQKGNCSYHYDIPAVAESHEPSAFLYLCEKCCGVKDEN